MAKKIKQKKILTPEEAEAQRLEKEEEAERDAMGIEDDFQARGFELVEWMQDNSAAVLGILAFIVLGGLVYAGMQISSHKADAAASEAYADAMKAYHAPVGDAPDAAAAGASDDALKFKDEKARATEANKRFAKVVSEHEGTGPALLARIYEGHTSLALEKYDDAARLYRSFLKESSTSDVLRFTAYEGLATALEAKGDKAGAEDALNKLISLPGKVDEDFALLRLAQLQKASGKTDAAKASLERIEKDFPESPAKNDAKKLLETLNG